MAQYAQLPDGQYVEFPDHWSEAQMDEAVYRDFADQFPDKKPGFVDTLLSEKNRGAAGLSLLNVAKSTKDTISEVAGGTADLIGQIFSEASAPELDAVSGAQPQVMLPEDIAPAEQAMGMSTPILEALGMPLQNLPDVGKQTMGALMRTFETPVRTPTMDAAITGADYLLNMITGGKEPSIKNKVEDIGATIRKPIAGTGEILASEATKDIAANQPKGLTGPGKMAYDVVRGITEMAPSYGIAYLTKNPAMVPLVMGAQVKGRSYQESRDLGLDPYKAQARSDFNLLAEGLPEYIPALAILEKAGPLSKIFLGAIGEGGQEMVTEVLQNVYDDTQLRNMSLRDAIKGINWGDVLYAGGVGAGAGVGMGGAVATADAVSNKLAERSAENDFNKRIDEALSNIAEMQATQALNPDKGINPKYTTQRAEDVGPAASGATAKAEELKQAQAAFDKAQAEEQSKMLGGKASGAQQLTEQEARDEEAKILADRKAAEFQKQREGETDLAYKQRMAADEKQKEADRAEAEVLRAKHETRMQNKAVEEERAQKAAIEKANAPATAQPTVMEKALSDALDKQLAEELKRTTPAESATPAPAAQATPQTVKLTHYSKAPGLTEIDPSFHGKGVSGQESKRKAANPDTWVDRSYFYMDDAGTGRKDVMLGGEQYQAEVNESDLYDAKADPDGLKADAMWGSKLDLTLYEKTIKEAGYKGYWTDTPEQGRVAAVFEKTPVTPATTVADQIKKNGGYSVNPKTNAAPADGYMVSNRPDREKQIPLSKFTQADVDQYMKDNADALKEDGAHFGAWVENGDTVVLDVSQQYASEQEALTAAVEHDQRAIYDVKNGKDIVTADIMPAMLKRQSGTGFEQNQKETDSTPEVAKRQVAAEEDPDFKTEPAKPSEGFTLDPATRGEGTTLYSNPIPQILKGVGKMVSHLLSPKQTLAGIDIHTPGAVSSLQHFWKRQFTKEGLLTTDGFEAKIKMEAEKNLGEALLSEMVHDLNHNVAKAFGAATYNQVSDADLAKVDAYLKGDDTVKLPDGLKPKIDHLRAYLDRMSSAVQEMVSDILQFKVSQLSPEGQQKVVDYTKGKEVEIPKAIENLINLYQTIESNKGSYTNRSYRAFDDPRWKEKVLRDADLMQRAEAFIQENNEDLSPDEVTGAVRHILQNARETQSMTGLIAKGIMVGSKDVSVLKKRGDVPEIIRELLGEYKDPKVNFVRSATKMQWLVANHHFLTALRTNGLGVYLFEKPTGQFDSLIAPKSSEVLNPISGLYTTEDFKQGLIDASDKFDGSRLVKSLLAMNSTVKYGKTILAPTTQARNFTSAAMFTIMNGHFNWRHMNKAFHSAKADLFTKDAAWRDYINHLISLGVLHNNPRANELRDALHDFTTLDIYTKGGMQNFNRVLDWLQRAYQVGDDFWKVIGFENELQNQKDAGFTGEEAEERAAKRIRDGYPTYSMVPRGIKHIKRWPLIGPFVSFPYEIARTTKNQVGFIKEDMKTNPKAAAKRVLGLAVASSATYAASLLSMMLLGLSDDDDEAVRAQLPPWSRNSQIIYLGYDENGSLQYLDASYIDPYTYLKKPLTALLSGNNANLDDKVMDSLTEMLAPFVGPDIAAGAIGEVIANKKIGSGSEVYNPVDSPVGKAKDIIDHLRKAIQPGVMSNAERIWKALDSEVSDYGKQYSLSDEALALVGVRTGTLNLEQSLSYKGYEFRDRKSSARSLLSSELSSLGSRSEKDIRTAAEHMYAARKEAYNDLAKYIAGAEKLNVPTTTIRKVLVNSGIPIRDVNFAIRGEVPPMLPPIQQIMDTRKKARLVLKSPEERERFDKETDFRRKIVLDTIKELNREQKR